MDFSEAERNVFRFLDDSRREVYADPLKILRRLGIAARELGADLGDLHTVLAHPIPPLPADATPDQRFRVDLMVKGLDDAVESLIPVVHRAFGTRELAADGSGLTEAEAMRNYRTFCEYMEKKRDEDATSPASSPTTAAGPGTGP